MNVHIFNPTPLKVLQCSLSRQNRLIRSGEVEKKTKHFQLVSLTGSEVYTVDWLGFISKKYIPYTNLYLFDNEETEILNGSLQYLDI